MSLRAPRRLVAAAAVPALVAGVALAAPAAAAPAAEDPKYKGSAFALQTRVDIGEENIVDLMLPDVVTFPSGGDKNLIELPKELSDVVTLKVLNASAKVRDGKLVANSSTAGLSVLKGVLSARVLNSDCVADRLKVSGDSQVAGLELMGTKIPVDPGPNFRIDVPEALGAVVAGGITIDEQNKLPGGGLQVRALHVELIIAPDLLASALKSASARVRAAAEQVVGAVESFTGQSLDSLLAQKNGPKARGGGAQAERSDRAAPATARPSKVERVEKATGTRGQVDAERSARAAAVATKQSSVAAEQTSAERAATAENTTTTSEQHSAKADEAAVSRQAAADQAAAEEAEAQLARRAERGAKPSSVDAAGPQQQAPDAAAAARAQDAPAQGGAPADADSASQAQATEAAQAEVDPDAQQRAARTDRTPVAKRTAEAKTAEQAQTARPARTSSAKSDGAQLRTVDRTQARPAAPEPDEDDVQGLIAIEVIVSEVNCVGARLAVQQDPPKRALPKTGGGDLAQDIAVTGLGLLLAGSAAAFVTRRRGRHSR